MEIPSPADRSGNLFVQVQASPESKAEHLQFSGVTQVWLDNGFLVFTRDFDGRAAEAEALTGLPLAKVNRWDWS